MALVKSVEKRIWDCEGFDVIIRYRSGKNIRSDKARLTMYPFDHRARKNWTVTGWKRVRFNKCYPGLTVTVLNGIGKAVSGRVSLGNVRESYR
jgi:ribosomal protein L33